MQAKVAGLGPDDPKQVGAYTVLGVLGSGGMGRVYLAESPGGRKVAIKVVQAALAADPDFRERFRREIVAARAVGSVYSAGLIEADPDATPPWMASRFINGPSLHQIVQDQGPLSADEVMRHGRSVAESLGQIHKAGFVHRDLKPSNVVIDGDGAHVIDFGIIFNAAESSRLTQAGHAVGTPGYMSPEQRRGHSVGPPSDVFSLAAVLLYALTGTNQRDLDNGKPPDLRKLPPGLAGLITACLRQEPATRPTAEDVVRSLRAMTDPQAVATGTHTAPAVPVIPPPPPPSSTPSPPQPVNLQPLAAAPLTGQTGPPTAAPPQLPAFGTPPPSADRPRRRTVLVASAVAAVLALGGGIGYGLLGRDGDYPAATGCPEVPAGTISALQPSAIGCTGYTAGATVVDGGAGFGRDPVARQLQAAVFANNAALGPARPGDLNLVWFGALSCPEYRPDSSNCADGREYATERAQLQGLVLAQQQSGNAVDNPRLRVIISDSGADMANAMTVADLVVKDKQKLGRVAVLGGGDSRSVTKRAITVMAQAGVPVIAPVLTSDDEGPAQPFVSAANYFQMSAPNSSMAKQMISFIADRVPAGASRRVYVYHAEDPDDLYTTSLARDVQFAADDNPRTSTDPALQVSTLDAIPATVCATSDSPAALVFVDRWNTFGAFAARLTELCGPRGPSLVIGGDSVNRFMTNDAARQRLSAPWPLAYFKRGVQCGELQAEASKAPDGQAAQLLQAALRSYGLCSEGANSRQIGDSAAQYWDGARLAAQVTTGDDKRAELVGASGTWVTEGGHVARRSGAVVDSALTPLCVFTVDTTNPLGRSSANCAKAFPTN